MSIPEGRPSLVAARRYLAVLVEKTRAEGGGRLPPIKRIAGQAGVSHAAVSEALAELRRSGTVRAGPRRGIELVDSSSGRDVAPVVYRASCRWRQVAAQLRSDLADGHYGHRPLPSRKELMGRYHVSKTTMTKALRALADEQTLLPAGKTYRLAAASGAAPGNTIVLFARGVNTGELSVYTPRVPLQLNALEQACLSRNVQLQIVPCTYRAGERLSFPGWEKETLPREFNSRHVLGYMVWQMGLYADFTRELANGLQRLRKPLAVFFERQDDTAVPGLLLGRHLRRYATAADYQAGEAVGRFLLSRGHRRVCCWWDREDLVWARERAAGIRHVLAEAGADGGVEHFSAFAAGEFDPSRQEQAIIADVRGAIHQVAGKWGVAPRDAQLTEAATNQSLNVYWEWAYNRLEPSMRRVLREGRCTAWVGLNDRMAVECLRFLRAEGARTPGQVALIGFDDSYEAAAQRLSSYNFNGTAAMNRMVDFLLWPNAPLARAATGELVEVQGFVHERSTTGPVCTAPSAGMTPAGGVRMP